MTELSVFVDYDDSVVSELIQASLSRYIPNLTKATASKASLQWSSYESLSFETILSNPKSLCNSYIFRKALIRKHFLATTAQTWLSKNPTSTLSKAMPKTFLLECDYADYLDEALNESFELREALEENEAVPAEERKYFILKPSMTDRGQGIRLFSTRTDLEEIFDEFDDAQEEDDEEGSTTGVFASQLRHFVVQEYMLHPLLLDSIIPQRKFHIRTYVVAFGAIKVWVWSEMLALFAPAQYDLPSAAGEDMERHLTNTCLQDGSNKDDNVLRFWSLPLQKETLQRIFKEICDITGEVFLAAAAGQQMHFQTLPNAFEIFGLDFIVDSECHAYLLEVNSYPDFKQTGERLTNHVVGDLFNEVTKCVICPFFGIKRTEAEISKENDWKKGWLEPVQEKTLRGNW